MERMETKVITAEREKCSKSELTDFGNTVEKKEKYRKRGK